MRLSAILPKWSSSRVVGVTGGKDPNFVLLAWSLFGMDRQFRSGGIRVLVSRGVLGELAAAANMGAGLNGLAVTGTAALVNLYQLHCSCQEIITYKIGRWHAGHRES